MKKYIKILLLATLFSFGWGIWWGFYSLEKSAPNEKDGPTVRVLAQKNYFTPESIRDIEKKNSVRLALTEKDAEVEVLREALSRNQEYDLILISSFVAKSFLMDNVFHALSPDRVPRLKDVSIDFRNLDYDPDNKYLVPLTWGLNGFLVDSEKISLVQETLPEIVATKSQVSFLPSAVELYSLVVKLKPIIKTWVESGQNDELRKELKELANTVAEFSADPRQGLKDGKWAVSQITNGLAANLVGSGSKYRFVLPRERGTLWLSLMGISRGAKDMKVAHRVLNSLISPELNQLVTEGASQATTLETLNQSSLPVLQKAAFIRQVPLSRVELFIQHDPLEPTWLQAVSSQWSNAGIH